MKYLFEIRGLEVISSYQEILEQQIDSEEIPREVREELKFKRQHIEEDEIFMSDDD